MANNRYLKTRDSGKRKAFEIALMLFVIAFLISVSSQRYFSAITQTQSAVVEHHAAVFSRMISNIHALGKISRNRRVTLGDITFFLNERGWPANTDQSFSSALRNQSAIECRQLWEGVFSNPPSVALQDARYNQSGEYLVSLNKNVICRYELASKEEGLFFIDYHVGNGMVSVSSAD